MKTMTAAQINVLNAAYDRARSASPRESAHVLTHQVAVAANLEVVREDDESGILYRNRAGRYVYGWQSGGFDDQVD